MGMGKKKGGFCCPPRTSQETERQKGSAITSQSKELHKIYTQLDQVEKVNQNLVQEIERMKKEKGSTT